MKFVTLIAICAFVGLLAANPVDLSLEQPTATLEEKMPAQETLNNSEKQTTISLEETDAKDEERKLSQIRIEEEPKKVTKKRRLNQKGDTHAVFLTNIDKMISEFGLDQKLDKSKIKGYFKNLEGRIYKNLKRSLFKQKEYMASYSNVIAQYKKLSEKYNIK